jgi:hypothetical protein
MSGRDEIPGGPSERVRKSGGEELRLQLATLLAGHPLDRVVWAMASELGSIGLGGADTKDGAKALLQAIADDAKNIVDINWGQCHARAVAMSEAIQAAGGPEARQ